MPAAGEDDQPPIGRGGAVGAAIRGGGDSLVLYADNPANVLGWFGKWDAAGRPATE